MKETHVRTTILVGPPTPPSDLRGMVVLPFRTFHFEDGAKHVWKAGAHIHDGLPYVTQVQRIFATLHHAVGLGILVYDTKDLFRSIYLTEAELSLACFDGIPDGAVEFVGGSFASVVPWPGIHTQDLWRLA